MLRVPSSDEVKAYREKHKVGMIEAKRILDREYMMLAIDEAKDLAEVKELIKRLIKEVYV